MEERKHNRRKKAPMTTRKHFKEHETYIRERYNKLKDNQSKGSGSTSLPTRSTLEGSSSLHQACKNGDSAKVSELIESDTVDINKVDLCGYTPLHDAVANEVTFDSLCQRLIDLLPVLKEPYKKDITVLSSLVTFLEQIQNRTILPDHLPFLLFCDSVFLRAARTRNETPPQPHHECNHFHGLGVKLMGQQFDKYMTGDGESLFHLISLNRGTDFLEHETRIEAVSKPGQLPAMLNSAVEELRERPTLLSHNGKIMNKSVKDEDVLTKNIKKEVTSVGWVVENTKIEEEPVPELYFKEDPDVKEERKPLLENTELYSKDETDVKDEMKIILKLEEVKDSLPENRGDVDNQNSCSISTKFITPEEINLEENRDSEYAASQNANTHKSTTQADDLPRGTESKNRGDHVDKENMRVRSVVSYEEDQKGSLTVFIPNDVGPCKKRCEFCTHNISNLHGVPENRGDVDNQNSCSISTKSITPEEISLEENRDSEYAASQNVNTHKSSTPADDLNRGTEAKNRGDHVDKVSMRVRSVVSYTYKEDQEELSSFKIQSTEGEELFVCQYCSYSTTTRSELKIHKLMHTEEKPFSCDKCSYSTTDSHALKIHQYKHTGEKLYSCDKCSYSTTRSHVLKTHKFIHTGEKPYCCDSCSYRTSRRDTLKVHQYTHTKLKPYSCDKCSYCATTSRMLKIHQCKHTVEKPYSCDKCSFCTVSSYNLKNHQRRIH